MAQSVPVFFLILALSPGFSQQPADPAAGFKHAVDLQRQGALNEAATEYCKLIALAPDYAEAHANLGAVLSRLGKYEEAIQSYQTALRLNSRLTPVLLNLGIAHYRARQFSKAVPVLEQFLAAAPESMQARQLLGLVLVELVRYAEAAPYLEQALTAEPDDTGLLYSLGLVYLAERRSEFRILADRLAAASSGLPLSHLLIGQSLLDKADYNSAAEELEAAAGLNPNLPRVNYSLGLSYFMLGRYKEAVACFEKELATLPRDFKTLYYLASLHEAQGDLALARQRLDVALKEEPNSPEANMSLGKILVKQSKLAEALAP